MNSGDARMTVGTKDSRVLREDFRSEWRKVRPTRNERHLETEPSSGCPTPIGGSLGCRRRPADCASRTRFAAKQSKND